MAWDLITKNNQEILSGDKPIDEIAIALEKIVNCYEDEFNRKPKFLEIMYALRLVLISNPEKYLSDPENKTVKDILNYC